MENEHQKEVTLTITNTERDDIRSALTGAALDAYNNSECFSERRRAELRAKADRLRYLAALFGDATRGASDGAE